MRIFWIYSLIAIAGITIMDLVGLSPFSALPLTLLLIIGWRQHKFTKEDIGVNWGKQKDYLFAIGYPVIVMSVTLLVIWIFGDLKFAEPEFKYFEIFIVSAVGIFGAFITEEGFFRGLLWRFSINEGQSVWRTLLLTTAAFSIWHIPVAVLEMGENFPAFGIIIYMFNVVLLGLNWGLVRVDSGSSIVAAVSHSVWNAIAYELFGFGDLISGIVVSSNKFIFSPENGILGILLNSFVFYFYFRKVKKDKKLFQEPLAA